MSERMDSFNPPESWKRITCIVTICAGHQNKDITTAAQCSLNTVKTIRHELETCNGDYEDVARRKIPSRRSDCVRTAEFGIWGGPRATVGDSQCSLGDGVQALKRVLPEKEAGDDGNRFTCWKESLIDGKSRRIIRREHYSLNMILGNCPLCQRVNYGEGLWTGKIGSCRDLKPMLEWLNAEDDVGAPKHVREKRGTCNLPSSLRYHFVGRARGLLKIRLCREKPRPKHLELHARVFTLPLDYAQLGLDQLEDIYHEARENLKPFLTAPESVESFREEEMFPLSDRLYAEYYAISKYLRRAVSAVDSKPFTTAVLDSASQASFVSEAVVNSLKIKRDHSAIPISGIGLSDSQSSGLSHVSVASLSGAVVSTNHPFLVLPVITRVASSLPPSPEFTAALKNVFLADPSFNSAAPIDCLLGASIFPTILTGAPRSLGPSLPYAVPTLFGDVLMGPAPLTPLSCNVACVSLLASTEHNPVLRNAPAYSVESHDPGPATLLFLSGERDSVDHSPDSQDPPIKMLHRSLEVEKTPPTKVLQLPLGSASEEFSLKPKEQTSKPPDELLETAPESPGIPLITTPESYSLNSISPWPRLFRVVATILARRSRNRSKPFSTRSCVWHAEIAVCQHIQQSRFSPQLNQTQAGKPLSKSWVRLSPFISDDGLIRAGGRLCLHSPSCPILLPNDHPLVLTLTDYLYVFFSQAGPLLFYFNLSGLWIFSARRVIKRRLYKRVTSYRAKSINHPHLLGDLPSSRVTAYPSLNSHFRVASGPGWHRTESFDKDRYGHISKPSLPSPP
ncbi:hypothetical protein AAG570_012013 [Ranatra chinensis]|uniref:Uncharacterized protein n=1 Tax=Ranatra chinensis TaxID=642074 RepID=A0ABD0YHS3_9HEMI